jgi:D-alanine-D-alanine ligase-like ATP-grasp enzyme
MRKIPLAFMMEMDILYLPPKKPGGASCLARVPMDMDELLILVIYNQEDLASRGDPGEFGALQATSVTARAAHKALLRQGYHAVEIPLSGSLDDLRSQLSPFSPQNAFIFNMCDEFGGTNAGLVDAVKAIEGLGFRHTASSPEVISLCVDKPRAKQRILEAGVDTPAFKVFEIPDVVCDLEFPLIVKPSREDGSLGIHVDAVAHNAEGLRWRVERILESYHQPAMAERFILGREFAANLRDELHEDPGPIRAHPELRGKMGT